MVMEVGGLIASPTLLPSDLIFQISGVTASPSSTWMFIWFAPASAKGSSRISGFEHIRCTSKNSFGKRADRAHDCGTERDVRHEMPIHDVQVQPIGARGADSLCLPGEPAEIRRQK